jgi:hypothetical protein
MAAMYETYRVDKMVLHYCPAVGSTVDGMLHVGIDYDPEDSDGKVQDVVSCSTKVTTQVWKETTLNIPPSRLNKAKWMYTFSPNGYDHRDLGATAKLLYYASGGATARAVGELWLEYRVTFTGKRRIVGYKTTFQEAYSEAGTYSYGGGSPKYDVADAISDGVTGLSTAMNDKLPDGTTYTGWFTKRIVLHPATKYISAQIQNRTGIWLDPGFLYRATIALYDSVTAPSLASKDPITINEDPKAAEQAQVTRLNEVGAYKHTSYSFLFVPNSRGGVDFTANFERAGVDDSNVHLTVSLDVVGAAVMIAQFFGIRTLHPQLMEESVARQVSPNRKELSWLVSKVQQLAVDCKEVDGDSEFDVIEEEDPFEQHPAPRPRKGVMRPRL